MAERTRATHMADKLRAELEWRGRVQGQEERRLRSHAQHAEEGRRRVEAQLACVAMEVERGQIDIAGLCYAPRTHTTYTHTHTHANTYISSPTVQLRAFDDVFSFSCCF